MRHHCKSFACIGWGMLYLACPASISSHLLTVAASDQSRAPQQAVLRYVGELPKRCTKHRGSAEYPLASRGGPSETKYRLGESNGYALPGMVRGETCGGRGGAAWHAEAGIAQFSSGGRP